MGSSAPSTSASAGSSSGTAVRSSSLSAKQIAEELSARRAPGGNKELFNAWAPSKELAAAKDRKAIQDEVDLAREEELRIRKQQEAILAAERAKRSTINTATKRNTIKTGAKGIPTTIASGSGQPQIGAASAPGSGANTIVGG
jgi:hypothetical protein